MIGPKSPSVGDVDPAPLRSPVGGITEAQRLRARQRGELVAGLMELAADLGELQSAAQEAERGRLAHAAGEAMGILLEAAQDDGLIELSGFHLVDIEQDGSL